LILLSMASEPNTINSVFPGLSLRLTLFIHFWISCRQFWRLEKIRWITKWYQETVYLSVISIKMLTNVAEWLDKMTQG
jgi:hypothetical protein